jgi:hypothetical protein
VGINGRRILLVFNDTIGDHSPPYTCVGSDKTKKHYPLASERQRDLQRGEEREICPITAGAADDGHGSEFSPLRLLRSTATSA